MKDESVLFVAQPDQPATAQIAFTPTKILNVHSTQTGTIYEPGRDYLLEPGTRTLTLTKDSRIPSITSAQMYPPRGTNATAPRKSDNGKDSDLLYEEGGIFLATQVAVTYEHQPETWNIPTLKNYKPLTNLARCLADKKDITIVLVGDSISTGSNSSQNCNVPPHLPGYGPQVAEAFGKEWNVETKLINLSAGGKKATWGIEQVPAIIAAKPDILMLAFGMNDASELVPADMYIDHIKQQINAVRAALPDATIVLIAGMTGNPEWTFADMPKYIQYRDALAQLTADNTALADVTSVWIEMARLKKYIDFTGNGLNHPNDFGHFLYADTILHTLRESLKRSQ